MRTVSVLSLAAGLALASGAQSAWANCAAGAAPNTVTCATTTTTNTTNSDAGTANSADRVQQFTTGGNITGAITGGSTLDGFGLAVRTSEAGAGIAFTNSGTINQGSASTTGGSGALSLHGVDGAITLNSTGSITGVSPWGVMMQLSGTGTTGDVTAHINTTISNTSGTNYGIVMTNNGSGRLLLDGTGNIGGTGANVGGILMESGSNNAAHDSDVTVSGSGTVTATGTANGITVNHGFNAGTVLINRSGAINGNAGAGILVTDGGTGGTTITGVGPITMTGAGIGINASSLVSMLVEPGAAISTVGGAYGVQAVNTPGGAGTVTINSAFDNTGSVTALRVNAGNAQAVINVTGGTISATGNAVDVESFGIAGMQFQMSGGSIASSGGAGVNMLNGLFGNGPQSFGMSAGTIGTIGTPINTIGVDMLNARDLGGLSFTTTGGTIFASQQGLRARLTRNVNISNIAITAGGAITSAAGTGIEAQHDGTGTITINGSGAITAGGNGISATQNNAIGTTVGAITIGGSGNVTVSGTGTGISVTHAANAGAVLVNRSGAINSINGNGIDVTDMGTGGTTISGTGPITVTGTGNGISAHGTANFTITPGAAITAGGSGVDFSNLSSPGNIVINSGFNVTARNGGGLWTQTGAGSGTISITGGTITSGSGAALVNTNSGNATITMSGGTVLTSQVGLAAMSTTGNIVINQTGGTVGTDGARIGGALSAISAQNVGANGTITVTTDSVYSQARGIQVQQTGTSTGAVNITNNGMVDTNSTTLPAIDVIGKGGNVTITNNGATSGASTTQGVVLVTNTAAGVNTITNSATGSITSTAANPEAQVAIKTLGVTTFNNAGAITGLLNATLGGGITLTNTGTWISADASNLGTATTLTNNTGGTITFNSGAVVSGTGLTVRNAGTVRGVGTITGNLTNLSGGVFQPGSSTPGTFMTVTGNLVMQSGSAYRVALNSGATTYARVTGTATLAGTVAPVFGADTYLVKQYTLLESGGRTGTFTTVTPENLPFTFTQSVSYDANNVYLDLVSNIAVPPVTPTTPTTPVTPTPTPQPTLTPMGPLNQQNVATALNNYFNNGGTLPPAFLAVYAQQGIYLSGALSNLSGEPGAAIIQVGGETLTPFLNTLFDRMGETNGGIKPAQASSFGEMRAWGSVLGGHRNVEGTGTIASHDSHTDVLGFAAGLDTALSPNTMLGAGVAFGRANIGIAQDLGHGKSDVAQMGAYVHHSMGDGGYLSGAVAYAWHDMATARAITIGTTSVLGARFIAHNYGMRLEGGLPAWTDKTSAITPYVAVQFDKFDLPAYSETALSGSAAYALSYKANSVDRNHTELGLRLNGEQVMESGKLLLSGRIAWQHNFTVSEVQTVGFAALPGSSFVVNGAGLDHELGLIGAGVTYEMKDGFSIGGKLDMSTGKLSNAVFGSLTVAKSF